MDFANLPPSPAAKKATTFAIKMIATTIKTARVRHKHLKIPSNTSSCYNTSSQPTESDKCPE